MRPNYAMDAPPISIEVGGFAYKIDYDYRTWIDVQRRMRQMIPNANMPAQIAENLENMLEIQRMVFGGVLRDENPREVLMACAEFARGYPQENNSDDDDDSGDEVVSLDQDVNAIIIAIRNQSGIDLSYRRKDPFHWWEFLLEFRSLCGDHAILRLMEIRGYKGKDAEMLRMKRRNAIRREMTGEDRAALDEFNAMFDEIQED